MGFKQSRILPVISFSGFGIVNSIRIALGVRVDDNAAFDDAIFDRVPWGLRLRHAGQRRQFVRTAEGRFGTFRPGDQFVRTPSAQQRAAPGRETSRVPEIFVTDFDSFSVDGFLTWNRYVPSAVRRWYVLIRRDRMGDESFRTFTAAAAPFHPLFVVYEDRPDYGALFGELASALERGDAAMIKIVLRDALTEIDLPEPLRNQIMATTFVREVYGPFETLLYEELLAADGPGALARSFGPSLAFREGVFAIDFLAAVKTQQLILSAA